MDEGMRGMSSGEGTPYESLDAELHAALNVEPSPEFVARVRTRIASEPEPTRWRLAWVMVPAVAMGVLVVALAMVRSVPEPSRSTQPMTQVPVTPTVAESAPLVRESNDAAVPRITVRDARRAAAPVESPQVVVSPDERRALAYVAAIVTGGRVADLSVEQADTAIDAVTLRDVEIVPLTGLAPLRIEPLQIARLETGERQ